MLENWFGRGPTVDAPKQENISVSRLRDELREVAGSYGAIRTEEQATDNKTTVERRREMGEKLLWNIYNSTAFDPSLKHFAGIAVNAMRGEDIEKQLVAVEQLHIELNKLNEEPVVRSSDDEEAHR